MMANYYKQKADQQQAKLQAENSARLQKQQAEGRRKGYISDDPDTNARRQSEQAKRDKKRGSRGNPLDGLRKPPMSGRPPKAGGKQPSQGPTYRPPKNPQPGNHYLY